MILLSIHTFLHLHTKIWYYTSFYSYLKHLIKTCWERIIWSTWNWHCGSHIKLAPDLAASNFRALVPVSARPLSVQLSDNIPGKGGKAAPNNYNLATLLIALGVVPFYLSPGSAWALVTICKMNKQMKDVTVWCSVHVCLHKWTHM